jgi:hypothetical protein
MSKLTVETTARYLDDMRTSMAVLRVAGPSFDRSVPYEVTNTGNSVDVEVPPGLISAELRLPNGQRKRASVMVDETTGGTVRFELEEATKHEWLAVQSFVVPKRPTLRTHKSITGVRPNETLSDQELSGGIPAEMAPAVDLTQTLSLEVCDPSASTTEPLSLSSVDSSMPTALGVVRVLAQNDAIRVSFQALTTIDPVSSPGWLLVSSGDSSRATMVALPPLNDVDVVIRERPGFRDSAEAGAPGSDESVATTMPAFDTDVVVKHSTLAPMLAYLARLDLESANTLYDVVSGIAHDALQSKLQHPGLAALGGYALVALGRFRPDDTETQAATELQWLSNLRNWFPGSADAQLLWATATMQAKPGEAAQWLDEVTAALVKATKLPVPMLSLGIRWLVDGLVQVELLWRARARKSGEPTPANAIRIALNRARDLNEAALIDEPFSTLFVTRAQRMSIASGGSGGPQKDMLDFLDVMKKTPKPVQQDESPPRTQQNQSTQFNQMD